MPFGLIDVQRRILGHGGMTVPGLDVDVVETSLERCESIVLSLSLSRKLPHCLAFFVAKNIRSEALSCQKLGRRDVRSRRLTFLFSSFLFCFGPGEVLRCAVPHISLISRPLSKPPPKQVSAFMPFSLPFAGLAAFCFNSNPT